jgi:F-box protein 9
VSAIDIYSKAVIAEENGNLDTALHLYRTAFRKYDAVDKLWRTAETQAMTREDGNVNYTKYEAKPVIEPSAIRNMTQQMASLSASKPAAVKDLVHSSLLGQAAHTASVTGSLEATVEGFPPILGFELEELAQQRTFTINSFPDEILVKILINLSPQLVERFALASRKARIMTLDSTLWRYVSPCACSVIAYTILGRLRKESTNPRKSLQTSQSSRSWCVLRPSTTGACT